MNWTQQRDFMRFFEEMPCVVARFLLTAMLAEFPDLGDGPALLLEQHRTGREGAIQWMLLNEILEIKDGQYHFKGPKIRKSSDAPDDSPQAALMQAMQQATFIPSLLRSWRDGKVGQEMPIERSGREGYVYLAYSETGHYKIGKSIDPDKRIKVLGTKAPVSIELVHTIECDDAPKAERVLHKRFKDKRGEGEWFSLSQAEVSQIVNLEKWENGRFQEKAR